jgi:ABC-2 type transport system permease protein
MLQAYWYIAKMRILTTLAYRFEVFASVGSQLILMFAAVFLWRTAYSGDAHSTSMQLDQIVTYSVLSILLGSVFICDVQNTIYNKIREGQIVVDFYRPITLLGCYLADDLGTMMSSVVNKVLPLFLLASIFFKMPLPVSFTSFILFIPCCVLSYAILWLLSAIVGLISFWVMELGNMGMVKDSIVRILSGSIIPLWFFPSSIQTISKFLPFQYTYQTPLAIYIGEISPIDAMKAMGIQFVWIAIFYALLYVVWNKAKKKTLIQGG